MNAVAYLTDGCGPKPIRIAGLQPNQCYRIETSKVQTIQSDDAGKVVIKLNTPGRNVIILTRCTIVAFVLAGCFSIARRLLPYGANHSGSEAAWRLVLSGEPEPANDDWWTARSKSVGYALNGLNMVVREEPNARIHLIGTTSAVLVGGTHRVDLQSWGWITLSILLIGQAKDMAAGAVLICAVGQGSVFTDGLALH